MKYSGSVGPGTLVTDALACDGTAAASGELGEPRDPTPSRSPGTASDRSANVRPPIALARSFTPRMPALTSAMRITGSVSCVARVAVIIEMRLPPAPRSALVRVEIGTKATMSSSGSSPLLSR